MSEDFLYEKDGPLTAITFNRPERRNCMNRQVMFELEDLLRDVRNDREVRILIVTGTGTAFSAGGGMLGGEGVTGSDLRQVMFELEDLLRDVRNDREVRILIVTGTGTAFSAGADMSAAKGLTD